MDHNARNYFITWSKQSDAQIFEIISAKEDYYIGQNHQKIFDLSSTSYHASFGHSYEPIINAIKAQLEDFPVASPKSVFSLKQNISKLLLNHLKVKNGKIFYTTSGAESIENALKMARQIKNKKIILARQDSYHGATLGALSVTGDWRNKEHFTIDKWTQRIPSPKDDPDLIKTEQIINNIGPENIAAFCLETITGGNGVILASQNWWNKIQELCKKYQLFLILDEVVCGFNRTGLNFGYHQYNIKPDLVCMAKGITGGYIPFGALYVSKEISDYYNDKILAQGLTNYAHPLGLKALEAVLNQIESKFIKSNLLELENVLQSFKLRLEKIKNIKEVRHIGLLMAIESKISIDFEDFIAKGILISKIGNNYIIAPPFIMTKQNLISSMSILEKLFQDECYE